MLSLKIETNSDFDELFHVKKRLNQELVTQLMLNPKDVVSSVRSVEKLKYSLFAELFG